jgi:hypothetical protein
MLKDDEEMLASYLVLLIGRLTDWNAPNGGGGDPVYLTAADKAKLAVEGIQLLATCLPAAAAQQVTSALRDLPRAQQHNHDEMLMRLGALGGIIPVGHTPGAPPGCCVMEQGRLFCVN